MLRSMALHLKKKKEKEKKKNYLQQQNNIFKYTMVIIMHNKDSHSKLSLLYLFLHSVL